MTADTPKFPITRLRRLRQHPALRDLVRDVHLTVNDLVMPLFIRHGEGVRTPVKSMPGLFQISVDQLDAEIAEICALKIPAVLLFGLPEYKDSSGSCALLDEGVVQKSIRKIKEIAPDLLVVVDLCLCEYTDHGHCGVIGVDRGRKDLDNDATLPLLAAQSVSLAKAGADVIAPSGMVDGAVGAIRSALDENGFFSTPIMGYSVKYASAFYGPFREATEGAPQFGDRRTYQMDPAKRDEALLEAATDIAEGADMLMVKPASVYMDIIWRVKQAYPGVPMAAYHVSGEYAMIKAAAQNGWIDEKRVVLEVMTGLKRAGADIILTYFAKQIAEYLR